MCEHLRFVRESLTETALTISSSSFSAKLSSSLGFLYDRALSQTPLDSHEKLWPLVYFLFHAYFSACKITSPVISFAGTVPSINQLFPRSMYLRTQEVIDQDLARYREQSTAPVHFFSAS